MGLNQPFMNILPKQFALSHGSLPKMALPLFLKSNNGRHFGVSYLPLYPTYMPCFCLADCFRNLLSPPEVIMSSQLPFKDNSSKQLSILLSLCQIWHCHCFSSNKKQISLNRRQLDTLVSNLDVLLLINSGISINQDN